MFETADEIIDALGGTGEVALALALAPSTVSSWRPRGIPSPHWLALVDLGKRKGLEGLTLEVLARMDAVA